MISGCECRMREDVRGEHPDGLELVEHVLDRLHQHGLEAAREGIRIIGVVLLQRGVPLGLGRVGSLLARLALQDELADRVDVAC